MKLGVRGKLFLVSLVLIVGAGLVAGVVLEQSMQRWLEARIEKELTRLAGAARTVLAASPRPATIEALDPLADSLGEVIDARVTIVDRSGRVLGDSAARAAEVAGIENHANRPEIQDAYAHGLGLSRRYSTTANQPLEYAAITVDAPSFQGVVRVAIPLVEVREARRRLRLLIAVGVLMGVLVAGIMSGLASHLATRNLRSLVDEVREVVRRQGSQRRVPTIAGGQGEIGRLAGAVNLLADELDQSLAKLVDERDRLERILESMTEGVLALDRRGRITLVNRAALELLDVDEPPTGAPLVEHIRVPVLNELVEGVTDGETRGAEFEIQREKPRVVLARAAPLKTTGGCVVVMHDITEMRHLETVRRDFVANVSHELRTPVSVIRANAETLEAGALRDPERARQFLSGIQRNAERLSRLIADLLDLSRIEAGRVTPEVKEVLVEGAARRAVEALAAIAADKGIEVRLEVPLDVRVRADAKALDQILLNYLDNAIKYTQKGGHVTLRTRSAGAGWVRIEVADDGPGIEPQHRDRVFERFYRVDPGRSREMGGTGLGLSIVKHLADGMAGKVGVDPASPRGSVFWIELPAVAL